MRAGLLDALVTIWRDMGLPWTENTPYYLTVAVMVVFLPFFLRNIRISQARNLLKRSNVVYHEERRQMEDAAIARVQDIPIALLGLADQAVSLKRFELVDRILTHVPKNKSYRREIERIQQRIQPTTSMDDWSQIQKVHTLIEQEMWQAARIQRSKISSNFEGSEEVRLIDRKLAEAPEEL